MAARASAQIAGVDGCKSGWIAVIFQPDAFGPAEVMVFDTFANLVGWLQPDSIIAVDMPIGLPERAIKGGRAPDWAAKEFLGPRRASVFLVPSRRAVYAREAVDAYKQGYRRVCAVARETSDPRRAPSIQAYSIFPRIQQIDQMLRQDKALRRRVFEVHPEVSFTVMNGDKPMSRRKSTAAFTRWACGVAKNFWRDKTLLRAFWRQNHRLGRLWTIFMTLAPALGAEHVSSVKRNASFPLSPALMQRDCK